MDIQDKLKVICISGKARSGKDTSAWILKEFLEAKQKKVLLVHYADLLKYICRYFCGWDGRKDEAGRTMLQKIGTDIVRKYDPEYWVKFVHSALNISWHFNKYDFLIIADCRFPNEIDWWLDNGFKVDLLKIVRPETNDLTEEQKSHSSETALDNYSRMSQKIINNNSLENLLKQIDEYRNWLIKDS